MVPLRSRTVTMAILVFSIAVLAGTVFPATEPVRETTPDDSGPVKLLTASWFGGPYDDALVGVEVVADGILLAGNTVDLPSSTQPQVFPYLVDPAVALVTSGRCFCLPIRSASARNLPGYPEPGTA